MVEAKIGQPRARWPAGYPLSCWPFYRLRRAGSSSRPTPRIRPIARQQPSRVKTALPTTSKSSSAPTLLKGTRVPLQFTVRSGRKEIILPPHAATTADVGPRSPLVVALARAYRWQRMIDTGEVPGVEAIAAQYGVNRAYVSRILGLAMLAPDLTQAVLKGDEPACLSLRRLAKGTAFWVGRATGRPRPLTKWRHGTFADHETAASRAGYPGRWHLPAAPSP